MNRSALLLAGALVISAGASLPARAAKPAAKPGAAKPTAPAAKKYDEAQLKALEAKLAKSPKDAKLKAEVAEANYQVGHDTMMNPQLPPRMKYGAALKLLRRSLELNPKHAKAAADKKMIEDVYKQMGRPIPQ